MVFEHLRRAVGGLFRGIKTVVKPPEEEWRRELSELAFYRLKKKEEAYNYLAEKLGIPKEEVEKLTNEEQKSLIEYYTKDGVSTKKHVARWGGLTVLGGFGTVGMALMGVSSLIPLLLPIAVPGAILAGGLIRNVLRSRKVAKNLAFLRSRHLSPLPPEALHTDHLHRVVHYLGPIVEYLNKEDVRKIAEIIHSECAHCSHNELVRQIVSYLSKRGYRDLADVYARIMNVYGGPNSYHVYNYDYDYIVEKARKIEKEIKEALKPVTAPSEEFEKKLESAPAEQEKLPETVLEAETGEEKLKGEQIKREPREDVYHTVSNILRKLFPREYLESDRYAIPPLLIHPEVVNKTIYYLYPLVDHVERRHIQRAAHELVDAESKRAPHESKLYSLADVLSYWILPDEYGAVKPGSLTEEEEKRRYALLISYIRALRGRKPPEEMDIRDIVREVEEIRKEIKENVEKLVKNKNLESLKEEFKRLKYELWHETRQQKSGG